jgi:hypothetical protein
LRAIDKPCFGGKILKRCGHEESNQNEQRVKTIEREVANFVMPGLVPGIHVLGPSAKKERGWPGQARP